MKKLTQSYKRAFFENHQLTDIVKKISASEKMTIEQIFDIASSQFYQATNFMKKHDEQSLARMMVDGITPGVRFYKFGVFFVKKSKLIYQAKKSRSFYRRRKLIEKNRYYIKYNQDQLLKLLVLNEDPGEPTYPHQEKYEKRFNAIADWIKKKENK